jgi:DNA-binding CsgD family transcriptional regulator/PAS domain-containing protein
MGPGAEPGQRVAALDDAPVLDEFDLPLVLVELAGFTIRAVSPTTLEYLRLPAAEVVGRSVLSVLVPGADQERARQALVALRDGVVDFYRASYTVRRGDGAPEEVWQWVRAVTLSGDRLALAEGAPARSAQPSPLARQLGAAPETMAIGTVDRDWTVTAVSQEVAALLGCQPDECIGQRLVGKVATTDVMALLDAGARASGDRAVALRVRLRGRDGALHPLRCVLTSLAGTSDRLMILMPDDGGPAARPTDRTAELEGHLLRIAAELEASGILQQVGEMPDAARFPELRALSLRQWEILTRLARGERVPTIASELFLSQSTVRNHLSAIFERFGVHSQPELLALLRRKD